MVCFRSSLTFYFSVFFNLFDLLEKVSLQRAYRICELSMSYLLDFIDELVEELPKDLNAEVVILSGSLALAPSLPRKTVRFQTKLHRNISSKNHCSQLRNTEQPTIHAYEIVRCSQLLRRRSFGFLSKCLDKK